MDATVHEHEGSIACAHDLVRVGAVNEHRGACGRDLADSDVDPAAPGHIDAKSRLLKQQD